MTNIHLIRRPEVEKLTGYKRSSLYARIQQGTFIPPVAISPRSVAWISHEVDQIIAAMINGKSEDKLKALVTELLKRRNQYEINEVRNDI